jgi:hypothetical protein
MFSRPLAHGEFIEQLGGEEGVLTAGRGYTD